MIEGKYYVKQYERTYGPYCLRHATDICTGFNDIHSRSATVIDWTGEGVE